MSTQDAIELDAATETHRVAVGNTALFGFFKVKSSRDGERWTAWGALERLTANDTIREPAEPVHFCFAATEEEAVESLTKEMDRAYGKRRWWRQNCEPNSQDHHPEPSAKV